MFNLKLYMKWPKCASGDAAVTGGTGRFSGASGGFHFSGEIFGPNNEFVATVDGAISSVGSLKQ